MSISKRDLFKTEYTMLEINFDGPENEVRKSVYEFRPWLSRNFKIKTLESTENSYTVIFEFDPSFFEHLEELKDLHPQVHISIEGYDYNYELFSIHIFDGQIHDSEPQNSFGIYEDEGYNYSLKIEGPKDQMDKFKQMFRDVYWDKWRISNFTENMDEEKKEREKVTPNDYCDVEFDTEKYIDFSDLLQLAKEFPELHFEIIAYSDNNDTAIGFKLFNDNFEFILDNEQEEDEDEENSDDETDNIDNDINVRNIDDDSRETLTITTSVFECILLGLAVIIPAIFFLAVFLNI